MDNKKEILRRDKKIEDLKKEIKAKEEEICAMHQLLDCAAANLLLAVKEKSLKISKKEVAETLGKFHLSAKDDGEGNCSNCSKPIYDGGSKACNCLCHSTSGFMKFIYKIVLFFWRLFRIQGDCRCGAEHY